MSRKSQVEKFEARQAKARNDEDAVKKGGFEKTVESKAEKIAKEKGVSTEDIFAIITQDSVGTFMKMWNNSMKNVMKETIRTEIRKVIQEEMAAAYKGIIKGMSDADTEMNDITNEIQDMIQQEVLQSVATVVAKEETTDKNTKNEEYENTPTSEASELELMMLEAYDEGINIKVGKDFKKYTSRSSTLYQNFMKQHKGQKGAWKKYVDTVLNMYR